MNEITVFGVLALTFMMAMYSLEGRHKRFTLAFAFGCLLSSVYGFLLAPGPLESSRSSGARLHCESLNRDASTKLQTEPLRQCSSRPRHRFAHSDRDHFVAEFSGTERAIGEYLMAELLGRQPSQVQSMLLRTSIIDRLNGELADLFAGRFGSEQMLLELEASI